MCTNLFQLRDAFLRVTFIWMGLAFLIIPEPTTLISSLIVITVAVLLYQAIPPNGNGATAVANTLAAWAYVAATTTALLLAYRLDLAAGWVWIAVILVTWVATTVYGFYFYNRLVTVPPSVMHVYTGPFGTRRVVGYAKIAPPIQPLERLQAVVPTGRRRLDVSVPEVGTMHCPLPHEFARRIDDLGPPDTYMAIHNIHRVDLGIEFSLDPSFYRLLSIPREDVIAQQRGEWGGYGRKEWHNPRFWSGIARGYLEELVEEVTRAIVHTSGWSVMTAWQRKAELAERIFEQLQEQAEQYGIRIHEVDVDDLVVDQPEALRRTRDLELLGEVWQRQQALVLETFHHTLMRLGLELTPHEIEALTRVHLWEMVSHLQRYGHLDFIVDELVSGSQGRMPHSSTHQNNPPPLRQVA